MSRITTKRIRIAVVALIAMFMLGVAAVAFADVFFQKTTLTANAHRATPKRVVISGKLKASSHKGFCTHQRPVEVTNLKTGKTKTDQTDGSGNYSVRFGLKVGKHAQFAVHYDGRRQVAHPHRHICGASNKKTGI